jgi:CheY-like chemotaxis protein
MREARRRKVWVTAVAYAALTVGLVEIVGAVSTALLFPDWTGRLVTFLLILGFPVVMVMAWIFDVEAGGLRRTPSLTETGAEPAGTGERRVDAARRTRSPVADRSRAGFVSAPPLPPEAAPTRRLSIAPATAPAEPPDPDRLKRAALGHVRHELRTPINAILGYSELLLEDETDPAVTADLRRIHESGRRLLKLVDTILDPARLAGSIDREIESYAAQIEADLRTPINAVIGYGEMLLEGQAEIGREVLVPDLERILAAARTLLATSGDIAAVATRAPGTTSTSASERLQDSSELASDIFRKIVASGVRAEAPAEGRGSLLVVDDNPTNRDLLTRQLARHGYIVAAATDGAEALERLADREFDLVLLDVIMPGMDGVETLGRIKQDENLRDIPVVMLSSLDEVDGAIRCIEAGAEEYITKPVQPVLLEARIAANLEVRRLRERERAYRKRVEADAATIDRLLLSSFPLDIAERIRRGETEIVEPVPDATILHCQLDVPRSGSGGRIPELLARLSHWMGVFESLAEDRAVDVCLGRKQGFLAVARHRDGQQPGIEAATMAELGLAFLGELSSAAPELRASFRLGIHSGTVVMGVVGRDRLRFGLWGEAADVAESLAAAAEVGQVLVTPAAHTRLRDRFRLEPGRVVEIRDLGQLRPSVLVGPAEPEEGEGA